MEWLGELTPVLILAGVIAGRVVRARTLSAMDPTTRVQLVASFDHHQVFSVAILAAVAAAYAMLSGRRLPQPLLDAVFLLTLVGFVPVSAVVAGRRRGSSDLPPRNVRRFALALGLQYAALALLAGLAVRW